MDDVYKASLRLHREHHGKLEVKSKIPLENKEDLSLAYTPGVGQVSVEIGKDPALAREYTLKRNTIAIVSDGSAILGLGNLGPLAAIPVMEGKAILFKKFGNIDAFPLCLATQNSDEIVETVKRIAPVFGGINLEDISAPRCFAIEARLQKELSIPVMHDDQHGTAVVVLAGLINALALKKMKKEDAFLVVNGAGAAGITITKLLLLYGFKNIIICDSKGIIHSGRTDVTDEKEELAAVTNRANKTGTLADAMAGADVFIGVSKGNIVTEAMVRVMRPDPVIFALANPVPEIDPVAAKRAGAYLVATGRSDFPNQVNNALAFPGIFRGALDHSIRQFTDEMFVRAAEQLAACIKDPSVGRILPSIFDEGVAAAVADAIR